MQEVEIAPGLTITVYWSDNSQGWVTIPEED